MGDDLILATMPTIPKYEVEEVLGVIYGSSTRTRGMGGRIISGFPIYHWWKRHSLCRRNLKSTKRSSRQFKG